MTSRRTRTPSDLKFLLNERAALAGLVQSGARDCRPLDAEAAKLEKKAGVLRGRVAAIRTQQAKWQAEIAAIDDVLQKSHRGSTPDLPGTVSAWAGKYGRRGELKAFIHSALQTSPQGMATGALVDAVIAHFHLALLTSEARTKLRHVVKNALHRSEAQGMLRSVRADKGGLQTVWVWRAGPSGNELALLAHGAICDPAADAVRGEVGG